MSSTLHHLQEMPVWLLLASFIEEILLAHCNAFTVLIVVDIMMCEVSTRATDGGCCMWCSMTGLGVVLY